ncbi:EamA family transporter [Gammaproteobacteria bacterium]|nr:EamA family transporter [Gammaproteobacteria bacterium]
MSFKDFLLATLVTAIWGLNFSVIKIGLSSLDPFTLAGVRFLLCAFPLVFFVRKPDVPMSYVASYGILFGVGLWGMVNLGIYFGTSAGIASLTLQTSVFFTIIMGVVFLQEKVEKSKIAGFILAILGLVFILNLADGSVTYIGLALIVIAALSWSMSNVIVKKSGATRIFSLMIWSSLFSPIPLFLLAYFTQGQEVFFSFLSNIDNKAIFSIFFQVYPVTLFGYWVWNTLINKYDISKVAPLSLLVPIFGLLGSYIIFDEEMSTGKIVACVLIISGLLVNVFGHKLQKQ